MNILSLFDGMSCAQIAINNLGIKNYNYFASEIDKNAIKVTMSNYPKTIQIGDVTKIKAKDLPEIDLLIGGSPCQGFSFAGKQLNFNDPRSALFFEFVRILKEVRPKNFILENVKMKKEYQDIISENLKVLPIEIDSSLVSAQRRKRLYWTNKNYLIDLPNDKKIFLKDILEKKVDNGFYYSEKALICLDRFSKKRNKNIKIWSDFDKFETLTASHKKGYSGQRLWAIKDDFGLRYISPLECERLQTVPENYTNFVSKTQRFHMLGNGMTVDVISHLIRSIL